MQLYSIVFQDWTVNKGRPHIQLLLLMFRLAQALRSAQTTPQRCLGQLVAAGYRMLALSVFSIDIPTRTNIGPRCQIHHGFALIIHADARVGSDAVFRHSTTIGVTKTGVPTVGNEVEIGAGAILLGNIVVGNQVRIGAGSVVTTDIPELATVAGNPARVIRTRA